MIEFMYKFLEKIGYAHPLHPPWTHIPMGLVMGAFIFILVGLILRRPILPMLAYRRIVLLALISAFPTMLFGYTDWQHFYEGAWLFPIKVKLALSGVLLILLYAAFRHSRHAEAESRRTLTIFALCFVTVTALGYFGGQLTFEGQAPSQTVPMKYAAGEKLYIENCGDCHPGGEGIINTRPLSNFKTFRAFLSNPKGDMPPFPPEKLSDQQVMRLYHYIKGVLWKPGGR